MSFEELGFFFFLEAVISYAFLLHSRCHKLLKKNMFHPEYVDIDPALLGIMMEEEMQKFLNLDLTFYIFAAINLICKPVRPLPSRPERPQLLPKFFSPIRSTQ